MAFRRLAIVAVLALAMACQASGERAEEPAVQAAEEPRVNESVVPLTVPRGFHVSVFAEGIRGVRFLALGPGGVVTATVPNENRVLLLPDDDGDGRADRIVTFHEGVPAVHGLAWHGDALYVAGTSSLLRLRDADGDGRAEQADKVSGDLPSGGGHWTRTVLIGEGPGDAPHLYVSAGSSCNVCIEEDPRRATVLRFPLSGGKAAVFATGLRNSVGLAWRPGTAELWGTDNGRDWLGDELPPDELNLIEEGGFYGWPYFYGKNVRDPEHEVLPDRFSRPRPARLSFPAHSAPLGITFYDGKMFPAEYRGDAFVAFHGSWNRSTPTGYKVVRVRFRDGEPRQVEDFLTGFLVLRPKAKKTGRPVCPLVAPDGSLLVSDDGGGRIFRVTYESPDS